MANTDPGPGGQPGDVFVPSTVGGFGTAYPIVRASDLLGGLQTVDDITARDALLTNRRNEGMLVYVVSTGQTFQLQGGILNANWILFSGPVAQDRVTFVWTTPPDPYLSGGTGDTVIINGAGQLAQASAVNVSSGQATVGVIVTVVVNGSTERTVQVTGRITQGSPAGTTLPAVVGAAALVPGAQYVLSTNPGEIVQLTDTGNPAYPDLTPGSGELLYLVGTAISATIFNLSPRLVLIA